MKKKFKVVLWLNDRIDTDEMIVEAKSEEDACIKAMERGNFGKQYYPQATTI